MPHRFRLLLLALAFGALAPGTLAQPRPVEIGVNLSYVADYATQLPFVDAFKSARSWWPQRVEGGPWDTGEPLALDADGWVAELAPGQAAGTILLTELGEHYPAGRYVVLYDGEGTLEFYWDAQITTQAPGRIELDVTPDIGIYLKLVATNPADPLRNIRVLLPGFEDTYEEQPFFPPFLKLMEGFTVLRHVWWGQVPYSLLEHWADRPTPSTYTYQTDEGVPYEVMIQLANTLGSDLWICVPHLATDDYVRRLARLLRDTLDPALQVYVEYSNEVWNGIYPGSHYAREQAAALGIPGDEFTAAMRFHSQRSVEIFGLFEEEFGATDRFVRVLGGWSASDYTAEVILTWQDAYAHADAYAIAPYFGGYLGGMPEVAEWSVERILDSTAVDMQRQLDMNEVVRDLVQARGLRLVTYEAGQHLVGDNYQTGAVVDSLFQAANRHPRMGAIYADYYAAWQERFGDLMVAYASCERYSQYGSWGLLERWDQDPATAPKWAATQDFIASLPTAAEGVPPAPAGLAVTASYPNPAAGPTTIRYRLDRPARSRLVIYDLLGRAVAVLANSDLAAGEHTARWDAAGVAAGLYVARLEAGGQTAQRRLVVVH